MAIRAFDIKQDFDVMTPLIKAAFYYPENDDWNLSADEITSIVDGFSLMRQLDPFLKVGGFFNASLRSIMRGFIWEEEGQAVGLVNLSPLGLGNQTWVIGNVAVLPEHRRKGIAGKLIEATIELARQHRISNVVLEVIANNVPAVKLYENKGFEIYSKTVQLHRPAALEAVTLPDLPEGYRAEPYQVRDWELRYTLMKNITPVEVQRYEPIDRKKFYKSPPMRLFRSFVMTLAPMKTTSYLVYHQATDTVVARFACLQRRKTGGINEIEIDLDPQHAAALASYLVHFCVHDTVNYSPGRDIELKVASWQTAVIQAALEAGFVNRAEWYMMGMHLNHPQRQV